MSQRFLIKLREPHRKSGLTAYAVAKQLGLNQNTVRKYLTEDVIQQELPVHVVQLIQFYGLDWQDPAVVEIIEIDDEVGEDTQRIIPINEEGEMQTPLAATA